MAYSEKHASREVLSFFGKFHVSFMKKHAELWWLVSTILSVRFLYSAI